MASKLCCTAEQEGRSGSPELPNARLSAATPANRPFLPKHAGSPTSHFTSARSEDLYELRQIFDNARDDGPDQASPTRAPRPRHSRQSIYSLHSLHKMTSMRSILRRKFSKDMPKKPTDAAICESTAENVIDEEPDTVIKRSGEYSKQQLKVTKEDVRNDLLSDKKPAEGGYDSDAEVLDDVARNIGKKTPSKRPSIHSVDWSPPTGNQSSPSSSTQRHDSPELERDVQSYLIQKSQLPSLSTRFTQVISTPNLRAEGSSERDRKLRRSHSATSMGLPKPSPISPLRLPSLTSHDKNGIPWSEVMSESLRLSQFPIPPPHANLKPSKTTLAGDPDLDEGDCNESTEQVRADEHNEFHGTTSLSLPAHNIQIRIQQPTSVISPRTSTSIRHDFRENAHPAKNTTVGEVGDEGAEENPRRSVHLHSMRISHHLRSGSLLSWDQLADAPDMPPPLRPHLQRTVSDRSRASQIQAQLPRHERQTSSSGFASNKVPSRWGRVLPNDRDVLGDVASSIYSSRPQSPPDSFGESMADLSRTCSAHQAFGQSSVNLTKLRRSNSFPTDNEETPRPGQRYGLTNLVAVQDCSVDASLLVAPLTLARKNSVTDTKKSKFREEFTSSPPRKKLTPSTSIMNFLNPKRISLRNLSEANLQVDAPNLAMDGPFDTLNIPTDRERRQSRSLMSLQAEQDALGKSKGTNYVWDKALKAHQEEKASMFLLKNKELAVHASPFRERSGSVCSRRLSTQEDISPMEEVPYPKRLSAPPLASHALDEPEHDWSSALISRRRATAGRDDLDARQQVAEAYDKQGDDSSVVGAWGRYPSHTRIERTLSAGKKDHVESRDFALEAAVRFALARNNDCDDDMVGPTQRLPSPPLLPGEKKRKKKIGSSKMAKSHSMTFGRKLIKNYSDIFKSSSSEFRRHGRGHRSSIASGGTLEHPELELLPEVFMSDSTDGTGGGVSPRRDEQVVRRHSERHSESKTKGKLPIRDAMATLRPRRNSSAPNLHDLVNVYDEAVDSENTQDRARVWSVYYETCVPSFPGHGPGDDLILEDFGGPSRHSLDSKRALMHSHTMPKCCTKHSRNASQLSRRSNMAHRSEQPSSLSMDGDHTAGEDQSLVSVRRSTMDLISMFKEQEHTEHERILSLTLAESRREAELLASL